MRWMTQTPSYAHAFRAGAPGKATIIPQNKSQFDGVTGRVACAQPCPAYPLLLPRELTIALDGMGADAHSMGAWTVAEPSKPSKYNFSPMRHAKSCEYAMGL